MIKYLRFKFFNFFILADSEPLLLQEVCRCLIRRLLRANAERDNPELCKQRPRKPQPPKRKRTLRKLVIPILESSDEEESSDRDLGRAGLMWGVPQRRIAAVIDIGRALAGEYLAGKYKKIIQRYFVSFSLVSNKDSLLHKNTHKKFVNLIFELVKYVFSCLLFVH